jgi:hypothetical protein
MDLDDMIISYSPSLEVALKVSYTLKQWTFAFLYLEEEN